MLRMPHARAPALSSAHSRADQTQQQQTPAMSHEWQGAGASGSAPAPEASRAVPVTCSPRCPPAVGGAAVGAAPRASLRSLPGSLRCQEEKRCTPARSTSSSFSRYKHAHEHGIYYLEKPALSATSGGDHQSRGKKAPAALTRRVILLPTLLPSLLPTLLSCFF